jgi:hypothetical protein
MAAPYVAFRSAPALCGDLSAEVGFFADGVSLALAQRGGARAAGVGS